jgi:class 3 adenylate cyclase
MAHVSSTAPDGPPRPRLSDEDRERVVEVLKSSCGDGRLTLDEFSARVEAAIKAVALPDLAPVLADLPHPFGPDLAGLVGSEVDRAPVPVPPRVPDTATATGRKVTRWTVSIMGGSQRRGRWRLREKTNAVAVMGGCTLDLRNAEVEGPAVVINAIAVMGGIEIIVPEGIEVELGGIAIMGGKEAKRLKDVAALPGSPIIRVRVFVLWGGVSVRSRPAHVPRRDRRAARLPGTASGAVDAGRRGGEMPGGRRLIDVVAEGPSDVGDDLKAAEWPDGTVTIMFSDIEGFTSITEQLGDRRALDILHEHNGIIRERVARCGGHEIKAQGDGFMVAFGGASRALQCAVGIQDDFAARNRAQPNIPVQVRLGLHAGEAIRDGNDFLGGAVILAARIAQQAKGGEIVVSSVLKELCDLGGEFHFGQGRDVHLKGLTESRRVYSVTGTGPPEP